MLKQFKTLAKKWTENRIKKPPKVENFRTIMMCESCYSFYYKNSWHFKMPKYFNEYHEEEIPVLFTQCAACLEQENALYDRESSLIPG